MSSYHRYIYDTDKRTIKGDFDGAYKNCDEVWPQQNNMHSPHFSYIRGFCTQLRHSATGPLEVLDIGCGYGVLVDDLQRHGIGNIVGYDISPAAIAKGKQRFGADLNIHVGDFSAIAVPDNSCDVVLLLGVLWFLLDDVTAVFNKIAAMLKPAGHLILTLHVPEDPIGKEIIGSYQDLAKLVTQHFNISDAFHWYQPAAITNASFSTNQADLLLRCNPREA